jgi:hypothetical protein
MVVMMVISSLGMGVMSIVRWRKGGIVGKKVREMCVSSRIHLKLPLIHVVLYIRVLASLLI